MIDEIYQSASEQMQKATDAFVRNLATIRTGRASAELLRDVRADYYGTPTPLTQVANVSAQDAKTLVIKPWEKQMLKFIEKGIFEAQLGLVPINDGDFIRISIPPLTNERRKEFARQAKQKSEDAKIALRGARRDANDMLKMAVKDGDASKDDEKNLQKKIQTLTDQFVAKVDEIAQKKETEIMTL